MRKRPHKVLGIELRPDNTVRVTDPLGRIARETLSWAALSAGQQAKLGGRAKRSLGENA